MRVRFVLVFAAVATAGAMITAQAPKRLNPMVELLAAKKPGEELLLSVRRGKEAVEVRVVVGAMPVE